MLVLSEIQESHDLVMQLRRDGKSVGLVPTMGALHEGHLSLIREARRQCDAVAVTIFVNPLQFGPNEDLDAYPKTLDADLALCEKAGVHLVFIPTRETMYPDEKLTAVHVRSLSDGLCGASRPGHFDGVTTVVAKLFNILPTDRAFFGEKDYQQLQVIRRMVADLNIQTEIVECPIIREDDGLALSSRNAYLSQSERVQASALSRALFRATDLVAAGEQNSQAIISRIRDIVTKAGPATIDYVECVDVNSLASVDTIDRPARICLAVRIGNCRLIDNVPVDPPNQKH